MKPFCIHPKRTKHYVLISAFFSVILISPASDYAQAGTIANSRPTLDFIQDHTVPYSQDLGIIELTGISAGIELNQKVRVAVSSSNSRLLEVIEVNQTSNGNAFIQYQLKKGAKGSSTITVLISEDGESASGFSRSFRLTVESGIKKITSIKELVRGASGLSLTAYPNPFASVTRINFSTPKAERRISLDMLDASGAKVHQLYSGSTEAGRGYAIPLNGKGLPPGVYIVRLTTLSKEENMKVVLTR